MRKGIRTANENAWLLSQATSRIIATTGSPAPTPSNVLAHALAKMDDLMSAAEAEGKALDHETIMGWTIEEFCSRASLPNVTTASLNERYTFTVTGADILRQLMAMNARLTLALLPTEVKSCWSIRCALRVFLLDACSSVPTLTLPCDTKP